MRVLAVSDLHYRLPHYDWLVEAAARRRRRRARRATWRTSRARCRTRCRSSCSTATSTGSPSRRVVLAASGNHDLDGPGEHGEQVAGWLRRPRARPASTPTAQPSTSTARGSRCARGGTGRAPARPSAPSSPRLRSTGRTRWVWLYHAPPAGTVLCKDGRREFPDHDLAGWIDEHQPDLVLCGHIHQAPWVDGGSWHARLGRPRSSTPAVRSARCRRTSRSTPRRVPPTWFGVFDVETDRPDLRPCGQPSPRGRAPSRSARRGPGGAPGCRGSGRPCRGGRPRAGELLLHVDEVLRHPVEPGRRDAQHGERGTRVVGEERQRVVDDPHLHVGGARTVAVAGLSSTTDISPKTAPGVSILGDRDAVALDRDARRTRTNIRAGAAPCSMSTSPAGIVTSGRSRHMSSRLVTAPLCCRPARPATAPPAAGRRPPAEPVAIGPFSR